VVFLDHRSLREQVDKPGKPTLQFRKVIGRRRLKLRLCRRVERVIPV
jgi:hypothetical protein